MQTRRARLQAQSSDRVSNRRFLESMAMMQPAALRQLANALPPVAREVLPNPRALLPPRGDYRYGDEMFRKYLYDMNELERIPTEEEIIRDALREYRDPITGVITPNPNFTRNNNAAIRFCTRNNYLQCVKILLRNPDVDVNVDDEPLYQAIKHGNLDMVKALVERGANIINDEGDESLDVAMQGNNVDIVNYLIEQGAEISNALDFIEHPNVRSFAIINYIVRYYAFEFFNRPGDPDFDQAKFDEESDNLVLALEEIFQKRTVSSQEKLELATHLFNIGVPINVRRNDLLNFASTFCDSLPILEFLIARGLVVSRYTLSRALQNNCYENIRYLISQVPVGAAVPEQ